MKPKGEAQGGVLINQQHPDLGCYRLGGCSVGYIIRQCCLCYSGACCLVFAWLLFTTLPACVSCVLEHGRYCTVVSAISRYCNVVSAISRYCTVVRVISVSAQTGACSWFIRPNKLSNHLATSNIQLLKPTLALFTMTIRGMTSTLATSMQVLLITQLIACISIYYSTSIF